MARNVTQRHIQLRRRQLDAALKPLMALAATKPPAKGWLHEIRQGLGMSGTQLAARLGITRPSLAGIEQAEAKKTITLKTLEKAAAALGCRVVYAVVPQGSLEDTIQARAEMVAIRLVDRLSHTMALEQQQVSKRERDRQIKEIADELVRTLSKELWTDP